jgi:hypothetical protein
MAIRGLRLELASVPVWAVLPVVALLSGCAVMPVATDSGAVSLAIRGTVRGGNQPISGATVQLFTPGLTGYASVPTAVSASTITDANGSFTIRQPLACADGNTLVFMRATAGNPGLAPGTNNSQAIEMALLGACGNLQPTTTVVISELTTVAAVWALAPFMQDYYHVGTSAANQLGLKNAFLSASQLASTSVAGGSGTVAANVTVPVAELNTLANVLAYCVNSAGGAAGDGTPCGKMLQAATTAGFPVPTNTVDAALNIASRPGANVSALYNLVATNGPFQPTLAAMPNDWSVALVLTNPVLGTKGAFLSLAVDGSQNVWFGYSPADKTLRATSNISEIGQDLTLLSPASGYQDASLYGNYAMAFDLTGNLWIANAYDVTLSEFAANGSFLRTASGGGVSGPGWVAVDKSNNVWAANFGYTGAITNTGVSEFTSAGVALSPSTGYTGGGAGNTQSSLALTPSGNAWVAAGYGLALLGPGGTAISPSGSYGGTQNSLAVDGAGSVWTGLQSSSTTGALVAYNSNGTMRGSYTGGGLNGGYGGVTIDGAGNVWITNVTYYVSPGVNQAAVGALSQFNASGQAISSSTGYVTGPNGTLSSVIDSAGNVWLPRVGKLFKVIGIAAPVVTPLSVATATGKLGQRP